MSDEKKKDVFSEVADGLGSLFKRAKAAVDHVPTAKIEEVVLSSAHKVGEAAKHASEKVPLAAIESAVLSGARVVGSAAKNAASKVPTEKIEHAVTSGAREVGRAFENVATTIQREMLGSTPDNPAPQPPKSEPPSEAKAPSPPATHEEVSTTGQTPTVLAAPHAEAHPPAPSGATKAEPAASPAGPSPTDSRNEGEGI